MKILAMMGLVFGASSCAMYPYGVVYDGTVTPHAMMRVNGDGANKAGTKQGEACAEGILGLVAWGDASVSSAKDAGGIKDLYSVEMRDFNILWIYHKACTVAHGN
jgi:hypothetical protein